MTKQFMKAPLWALFSLALWITACSDDPYQDVDGQQPNITMKTEHLQSAAGRAIFIQGTVSDKDGIATIDLECSDLNLNKTINLIEIYEKPLETYELDYKFNLSKDEIGERFTIKVIVTDVGGRSVTQELLLTMDGDFENPSFSVLPEKELTTLIRKKTQFNLRFAIEDDRALDYVEILIPNLDGYTPRKVEANGQKSLTFAEKIILPNVPQKYNVTITAFDKMGNKSLVGSVISVSEMPDFNKMYLADVATVDELNSDIFGVPMLIEHTGAFEYKAWYYCRKANTEIFFIPQKSDFSPICFGLDPENNNQLTDDPEAAKPIVLKEANVYYEVTLNVKEGSYSMKTYPIAQATNMLPQPIGSDFRLNPSDAQNIIPFQIGVLGNLPGCDGSPGRILVFAQDQTNPNLFYSDDVVLEAGKDDKGDDKRLNFIIHNKHDWGWWDYCLWRLDNSDDPEVFLYGGSNAPQKPKDTWGKPIIKSGKFKFWFDAHLERGKLVQVN